jgi:hypothetical protein
MTNSVRDKRSTNTGTEERTSPETGEFVSNRGTKFEIVQIFNGLWKINMCKGGAAPQICDGFYTNRNEAVRVLSMYLRKGDRLGLAVYPDKE